MHNSSAEKPVLTVKPGINDPGHVDDVFLQERPLVRNILDRDGHRTLREYSASLLHQLSRPVVGRKREMIDAVKSLLEPRLGKDTAQEFAAQLDTYFFASTFDHHGSINTGMSVSANLFIASGYSSLNDSVLRYIPVFSCASVSMNNEDFPRGIQCFGKGKNGLELQKIPVFPSSYRSAVPVYRLRPFIGQEVEKAMHDVDQRMRAGIFTPDQGNILRNVLRSVYGAPDVLAATSFPAQATIVADRLWSRLFPDAPRLVYLEEEEIATRLLLRHHLHEETSVSRLLFDPSQRKILDRLWIAMERFLRQERMPTYIFWGVTPDTHKRFSLELRDGMLTAHDGSWSVHFTASAVAKALEEGLLMPHMFAVYLVLHAYYGLNCLGGFNQIHYLEAMRLAYNESDIDTVVSRGNGTLYGPGMDYLFLEMPEKHYVPACALDLLLYPHDHLMTDLHYLFGNVTLRQAFAANAHIGSHILNEAKEKTEQADISSSFS